MKSKEFSEAFNKVTDGYEEVIYSRLCSLFTSYINRNTTPEGKILFPHDPWSLQPHLFYYDWISRRCIIPADRRDGRKYERDGNKRVFVLKENWQESLFPELRTEATVIVAAWRAKIMVKMEEILQTRTDVVSVETMGSHDNGMFRIRFENGDQFSVQTKMIINVSSKGKLFNQWPSTFCNVQKGGELFKKQSEKWMKGNFAK